MSATNGPANRDRKARGSAGEGSDPGEQPRDEAPQEDASRREPMQDETAAQPPTPLTQQIGRIAIVVLAVLFGIFAVANSHAVDFSWVVGETQVRQAPGGGQQGGVLLILLLLAAFAFGAAIGALVEWQFLRGRRARRAARRAQG